MTKTLDPIGVIGIGLMGTAITRRLRGAGFAVLGHDVDAKKMDALGALGGRSARSLAEIAGACKIVVLCVFTTDQVEEVVEALLAARSAGPPLTVVCTSTVDPDRIAALARRLPADRMQLVEAPVSGSSEQTARGEALGLIGGDPKAIDAAAPVLDAICPRRHHLGAAGNGGRAKLAINLILDINRAGLAEGLVFAERVGLDPAAFLKVARDSAAYSQIMDVKGTKMVTADFSAHGRITQTLKDILLTLEQAARSGQQLPLGAVYADLIKGCVAHGEAEWDNSAVIQEIRRRAQAVVSKSRR
ncbi:MAG TPA: NAD(P)-dependent oxidoreductase [Methylomirabilota bacterium]|jgi:3-hydroxyisobutyrate dehydrogenase-like beta-hydroxyacid dehydrogenase